MPGTMNWDTDTGSIRVKDNLWLVSLSEKGCFDCLHPSGGSAASRQQFVRRQRFASTNVRLKPVPIFDLFSSRICFTLFVYFSLLLRSACFRDLDRNGAHPDFGGDGIKRNLPCMGCSLMYINIVCQLYTCNYIQKAKDKWLF